MVLPKLEEIKKRRQALNLSQEYLARKAGVTRVLISQIERNHHSPSYDTVDRIFTILENEENEVMKKGMTAGEICVPRPGTIKKQLVTVSSHNTIKTAESKMGSDGEISQLPVIDKGECIGLVTSQSILKKPPGAKIVKDVMTSYFPDFLRLSGLHSIWQFSEVVLPPLYHGSIWSPSISSISKCFSHFLQIPFCLS